MEPRSKYPAPPGLEAAQDAGVPHRVRCSVPAHLSQSPTNAVTAPNQPNYAVTAVQTPEHAGFSDCPPPQFPSVYPCMRLSRGLTCRRAARLPRSPIGPRGWQSRPAPCLAASLRRNERGPLRAPAPAKASAPAAAAGGGRLSAGREALSAELLPEQERSSADRRRLPVRRCALRGGRSASGEGERRGEAERRGWTGNYQIDVISLCLCLIILNSIAQ